MAGAWWVIHEEDLLNALKECHEGTDPEIVLLELIANSNTEKFGEENG